MPTDRAAGNDPALAAMPPRRREVLGHVAAGLTNEQIAHEMGIRPATVRTHVTAVLRDLGVNNRTEAAGRLHRSMLGPSNMPRSGGDLVGDVMLRPAVAVLGVAHDGSPGATRLSSALGQELSALLAGWCWFPVIAHASSRNGQSLADTAPGIGAALNARFLVEPAIRSTGVAWRVTIQAIDVRDGLVIWSGRRDLGAEPWSTLDEVCASIVAAAYPMLVAATSTRRLGQRLPTDAQAWELAHQGHDHQRHRAQDTCAQAIACFEAALERDPQLIMARYGLGLCAYDAVLNQWQPPATARAELLDHAEFCVTHAPHMAEGYFLLGRYHQTCGDHAAAATVLEDAVARNPSFADAYALMAQALMLCGRHDEALTRMQYATRLGPRVFVAGLATLHFARGEYRQAQAAAEQAVAHKPRYSFARALAAASAWWAGDETAARDHLDQLEATYPAFAAGGFVSAFGPGVPAVEHFAEGLRLCAK